MLNDQLPKGQKIFSENDVREFLEPHVQGV
jgi:hypothetical protein